MKERMLDELLEQYKYKEPQYISNREIIGFFQERHDDITFEVLYHIREYFWKKLCVPRKSFIEIETWLRNDKNGVIGKIEMNMISEKMPVSSSLPMKKGEDTNKRLPFKRNHGIDEKQSSMPPGFQRFREILVLRRYSPKTVKSYLGALRRAHEWFVANMGIPIGMIGSGDMKNYFLHLIEEQGLSPSGVRVSKFALSFYFKTVIGRPLDMEFLEGMKSPL